MGSKSSIPIAIGIKGSRGIKTKGMQEAGQNGQGLDQIVQCSTLRQAQCDSFKVKEESRRKGHRRQDSMVMDLTRLFKV